MMRVWARAKVGVKVRTSYRVRRRVRSKSRARIDKSVQICER